MIFNILVIGLVLGLAYAWMNALKNPRTIHA